MEPRYLSTKIRIEAFKEGIDEEPESYVTRALLEASSIKNMYIIPPSFEGEKPTVAINSVYGDVYESPDTMDELIMKLKHLGIKVY